MFLIWFKIVQLFLWFFSKIKLIWISLLLIPKVTRFAFMFTSDLFLICFISFLGYCFFLLLHFFYILYIIQIKWIDLKFLYEEGTIKQVKDYQITNKLTTRFKKLNNITNVPYSNVTYSFDEKLGDLINLYILKICLSTCRPYFLMTYLRDNT